MSQISKEQTGNRSNFFKRVAKEIFGSKKKESYEPRSDHRDDQILGNNSSSSSYDEHDWQSRREGNNYTTGNAELLRSTPMGDMKRNTSRNHKRTNSTEYKPTSGKRKTVETGDTKNRTLKQSSLTDSKEDAFKNGPSREENPTRKVGNLGYSNEKQNNAGMNEANGVGNIYSQNKEDANILSHEGNNVNHDRIGQRKAGQTLGTNEQYDGANQTLEDARKMKDINSASLPKEDAKNARDDFNNVRLEEGNLEKENGRQLKEESNRYHKDGINNDPESKVANAKDYLQHDTNNLNEVSGEKDTNKKSSIGKKGNLDENDNIKHQQIYTSVPLASKHEEGRGKKSNVNRKYSLDENSSPKIRNSDASSAKKKRGTFGSLLGGKSLLGRKHKKSIDEGDAQGASNGHYPTSKEAEIPVPVGNVTNSSARSESKNNSNANTNNKNFGVNQRSSMDGNDITEMQNRIHDTHINSSSGNDYEKKGNEFDRVTPASAGNPEGHTSHAKQENKANYNGNLTPLSDVIPKSYGGQIKSPTSDSPNDHDVSAHTPSKEINKNNLNDKVTLQDNGGHSNAEKNLSGEMKQSLQNHNENKGHLEDAQYGNSLDPALAKNKEINPGQGQDISPSNQEEPSLVSKIKAEVSNLTNTASDMFYSNENKEDISKIPGSFNKQD